MHSGRKQFNVHAWIVSPRSSVPVAAFWAPSEVLVYVFVRFFYFSHDDWTNWKIYCIKFCHEIQQVFGYDALGVTQIKEGSVESHQHSGRPQTARNAAVVRVENLITRDRLTIWEIAKELGSVKILHMKFCVLILTCAEWLRQCSSTFIAPDLDFLGETWNSSRSPTSLLSRYGSMQLLVVSKIERLSATVV